MKIVFFGKERKLDENNEFKVGRDMYVCVDPDPSISYAQFTAFGRSVSIYVSRGRSRADALRKLERRLRALQNALDGIVPSEGGGWAK